MGKRRCRQPVGIGGKFIQVPLPSLKDLRRFTEEDREGCRKRRKECQIGRMDRGIWKVLEEGRVRKVVELFWEEDRGKLTGGRLKRRCKTPGCLNEKHYELKEKLMVNDRQARSFYEKAMRDGEARLALGNAKRARQLRMNIYARRAIWKRDDPLFYAQVETYGLFIENGDLICRKHGEDLEELFKKAGCIGVEGFQKPQEILEQEIAERLKEVERDEQGEVLKELGYTVGGKGENNT